MRRATGFCVALAFTILPPGAFASRSPIGEPTLPELTKLGVAYASWNELTRGALEGDASSAEMMRRGSGMPFDNVTVVKLNEAAASAGIGSAAFDLEEGDMLGWAGERSASTALGWYRRSATLGCPKPWFSLGRLFEESLGVSMDPDEALTLYQLAGNNKVVAEQLRLGDIAHRGELGQLRDDHAALRWYGMAASQGSSEADERIGDLYREGSIDLPRDLAEAVRHYSIAAAQGLATSARKLAVAYANGDGVAPDDALMLQWARKAAEAGDPVAAGMLGYSISIGIDGSYDLVEATTWLTLATERAHSGDWRRHAAVFADDAQRKLTPVERHAFQARLARWRSILDPE